MVMLRRSLKSNVTILMIKQSIYTDDDITNLQLKIDNFFSACIELSGNHTQHGRNYGVDVEENERSYLKSIFVYF
jgi:hypothetical protein